MLKKSNLYGSFVPGLAAAICLLAVPSSKASVILSFQPVTIGVGTTDNTFDVTLFNQTASAITVAGFSFGLQVSTTNLTFTAVDTSTTAAYIFAGNSLFGPDISVQPPDLPGQTLEAQDLAAVDAATVAAGATVGLGDVHFDIAPGTPLGPILVSFLDADDSVADPNGAAIPFTTVNSSITVFNGVPEPGSFALLGAALLAVAMGRRFKPRLAL